MSAEEVVGYTPMSPEDSPTKSLVILPEELEPGDELPEVTPEDNILTSVSPPEDGLLPGEVETVKTFILKDEGHTMGNLLRDQIMKYPLVNFCGYSMPHPGEGVIHLRIQTVRGSGAEPAMMLKKGLEDIISMCDSVEAIFNEELEKEAEHGQPEPPPLP
ncbi:DNA-directed RNA polymerases I and III subunit RPAC2 [Orchesella cincta]|uniref:DNA-directed RNA polymerase I subunit D n=1 Tax=Orchesella cincta TaxID=48709 RepID=A0A1D2MUS0_ORCCI|nr:DNA-directed RNA polymerases I and III subunit RPAC2 [Orchesella cincta]